MFKSNSSKTVSTNPLIAPAAVPTTPEKRKRDQPLSSAQADQAVSPKVEGTSLRIAGFVFQLFHYDKLEQSASGSQMGKTPQKQHFVLLTKSRDGNTLYEGELHIRVKILGYPGSDEIQNSNYLGTFLQENDKTQQPYWVLQFALIVSLAASLKNRFEHSIDLFSRLKTGEKLDPNHAYYAIIQSKKLHDAINYAKATWPSEFAIDIEIQLARRFGQVTTISKFFNKELQEARSCTHSDSVINGWLAQSSELTNTQVQHLQNMSKNTMIPRTLALKRNDLDGSPANKKQKMSY